MADHARGLLVLALAAGAVLLAAGPQQRDTFAQVFVPTPAGLLYMPVVHRPPPPPTPLPTRTPSPFDIECEGMVKRELVTNGDMETEDPERRFWYSVWHVRTLIPEVTTDRSHSGVRSLRFQLGDGDWRESLNRPEWKRFPSDDGKAGAIVAGHLSFWWRVETEETASADGFKVFRYACGEFNQVNGGCNTLLADKKLLFSRMVGEADAGRWHPESIDATDALTVFLPPIGTNDEFSLVIRADNDRSLPTTFYFDDVSLVACVRP